MKTSLISLAAMLSLVLIARPAVAQTTDPEVKALLEKVAAAYRDVSTLSTTIETTEFNDKDQQKITAKLILQKPDKLSADISAMDVTIHVVADGKTVYTDSSRDKSQYMNEPVENFESVMASLQRAGGGGVGLLGLLLTAPDAQNKIIPGKPSSISRQPDEKVGDEMCDVIAAKVDNGGKSVRFVFDFGKQDHLIRRINFGPDAKDAKPTLIETYTNTTLKPILTDATFKYTPAAGAVAVTAPKEPDRFDPRLKVGAAPLAIAGKDLAGKETSLDQYKGKVLLIDFWATWCGPCVAELPNVVAAYNKYHGQGFEILGISLDQPNTKPALEKFLADNKMPWRQIYDGKYWDSANAQAWGVHAIPFTVLIGKDGIIAAVDARAEELAPAIEAALKKP